MAGAAASDGRVGKHFIPPNRDVAKVFMHRELDAPFFQEDHRSRFYEHYNKEAEEYDREFAKKYDEDLNTTLIFVSFVWCSGTHMR